MTKCRCGRLVDLIDFYRNKELHVKALKLLEDPSKGLTDPAHVIKYLKVCANCYC